MTNYATVKLRKSLLAGILAGSIGFATTTTWLQVGIWVLYLASILSAYLAPAKKVPFSVTHE